MPGFNNWGKIGQALHTSAHKIVIAIAGGLQHRVEATIIANGQVDTGFLLSSVYTMSSEGSTYGGGKDALPDVAAPSSPNTAYVAVAANYAVYQELGTRYLPPRPFFAPSVEDVKKTMDVSMLGMKATIESVK